MENGGLIAGWAGIMTVDLGLSGMLLLHTYLRIDLASQSCQNTEVCLTI